MINNYIKVAQCTGTDEKRRVTSELFPFDDKDADATADVFYRVVAFAVPDAAVSVFRRVPALVLPEIGRGGGFA